MQSNDELLKLGERMLNFCKKFNIPMVYLFDILEDQKVTPMIRGKAMEYNAFILLEKILPKTTWSVQKLNLNAQPELHDEDIGITHRKTGIILKVECKSAVRESMNSGVKARNLKVPHFKVKCHRSRSSIKLADTSNDRYSVESFDIIITNAENAIYKGNTVGENLEIIQNQDLLKQFLAFYEIKDEKDLIIACCNDWRFVIPEDIAENGFIPRTPFVKLTNDDNWKNIANLESCLNDVIEKKRKALQTKRRS